MDVPGNYSSWIAAIVLLFCAMFFAVTETAFSASSRPKLKAMSEMGNAKAQKALGILDNFDHAISTILICTNIIHLSIASIVTLAVTRSFGLNAVAAATIITTMAVFLFGEMLPKSIAKKYAEPFALFCAGPLRFFMAICYPFSVVLSKLGTVFSNLVKGEPEISVTEDELYDIIEDMTEEGTLDSERGELISSAIQFGELTVESILTPRVDLTAVSLSDSSESVLETIRSCSHSRLPVFEKSIDNVVGILQIRKYIKAYMKDGDAVELRELCDDPFFVHASTKIDDLLPLMSRNRQNIAVVTDNYGGTLGIVTIEDILEELVGEIWDEDDIIEEPVTVISDREVSISADEHVADVIAALAYEGPADNPDIVDKMTGAWAFEHLGGIPRTGDSFLYHDLLVTVSDMDHNRITRLNVRWQA